MRWFEGTITAAITQAKQRRVLFVVYIHGDDDDSKKMNDVWEDTAVTNVCEETKLIAIKFHQTSEECKQFSQFYPVLCVPSVSLISGETGVPLEGVAGYVKPDEFAGKIKSVNETLKQKSSTPVSQTGQSPSQAAASSPPQTEAEKKENLQERAARLRQKMEAVHQQKEAKKKDEQRQKEIERRKMGQNVQKQQHKRAEEESRKVAEELRKERLEDKLAKEKVREQIARDRAEKTARFAAERKDREQTKAVKEVVKETVKTEEQKEKAKANMETARLQFRLPDGSAVTQQFPSSSTLQEAHNFVAQHVGDAIKQFTFSTTFPRRRFTASDLSRTFLELELAPSAALVVLPGIFQPSQTNRAVASSSGGGFFMMLFSPLLFIWNVFYNFLFGRSNNNPPAGANEPVPSPPKEQTSQGASAESTGARPKSTNVRRRTPGGDGGSSYKKDGNIHRLVANSDEDDDENNTWNGNSTQQM